jgi:hypothetical protein
VKHVIERGTLCAITALALTVSGGVAMAEPVAAPAQTPAPATAVPAKADTDSDQDVAEEKAAREAEQQASRSGTREQTAAQKKAAKQAAKKAAKAEKAAKKAARQAAKAAKKAAKAAKAKAARAAKAAKLKALDKKIRAVSGNGPEDAKRIAKLKLLKLDWGNDQYQCLVSLWNAESGWGVSAGRTGGPYGIPQANPGTKMASAGSDWATSAETQIDWGIGYIKGRYGTPCGAWSHFRGSHWY